jgi:ubiquitin C-terminal hydrolase
MDADIDVDAIAGPSLLDSKDATRVKASSRLRGAIRDNSVPTPPYSHGRQPSLTSNSMNGGGGGGGNDSGAMVGDELLGFTNIGNTCFMNSTLQCLLRTQRLKKFLLTSDLDRVAPRPAPLATTLQDICRRMYSSSGGGGGTSSASLYSSSALSSRSIAPSNFKNCLASYRRAFAGFEQHDAHEFLRFTLDGLHDETNAITKPPPYVELKDIDKEGVRDTAARWLDNHAKRNVSVVQDAFCGQFASETVCEECRHHSVSCETFLDLSLPIPRSGFGASNTGAGDRDAAFSVTRAIANSTGSGNSAVTIQNALEEFFAPAELAGSDAYHCPKCKKPTRAKRVGHIFQAPEVLVVHLKRFRHSRFLATKINDLVRFPVEDELNIASFMHPQVRSEHSGGTSYQLQGVVHHMGSVHSGHYIAHCRCFPKQGPPSRWFEFNDSTVTPVSSSHVESALVTPSAYILIYERTGHAGSKL